MKHVYCKKLSEAAKGYVEHKDHEPQLAEIYLREYNRMIDIWQRANDNGGKK